MRLTRHALAIAMLMAITLPAIGSATDSPRLRMHVTPAFGVAPAVLRIDAFVSPADDNRAVEIVADGEDYYRRSVIPLEGARAATAHCVEFSAVPAGDYDIHAALVGSDGAMHIVVTTRVLIVS